MSGFAHVLNVHVIVVSRIWGDYGQRLLEDTQIVIESSGPFFERVKVLLSTSGCKNVVSSATSDKRAIFISADAKDTTNPCFTVRFNANGINIHLRHPKLLTRTDKGGQECPSIEDCWIEDALRQAFDNDVDALQNIQLKEFLRSNHGRFAIVPEQCNFSTKMTADSPYEPDLMNEYFAAAYLAAEVQKLCTHKYIPERRVICIRNCQIKFLD